MTFKTSQRSIYGQILWKGEFFFRQPNEKTTFFIHLFVYNSIFETFFFWFSFYLGSNFFFILLILHSLSPPMIVVCCLLLLLFCIYKSVVLVSYSVIFVVVVFLGGGVAIHNLIVYSCVCMCGYRG